MILSDSIHTELCSMQAFLTDEQIRLLEESHRCCKDKRQADRIKTLLSLDMGYSYEHIARILLLDDSTLRNYYADYIEGGIDGLLQDNYHGGKSRLSLE